jgi:hypothetical protein
LFDACEWNTLDTDWDDIFYAGVNDAWAAPRIITRASMFKTDSFGITTTRWNCPDTDSLVLSIPSRFDLSVHTRRIQGPQYTLTVENAGAAQGVSTRTRVSSSGSGYSWAGATLTFTAATPAELLVGDILFWQTKADAYASSQQFNVPAIKVTNIASSTITAVAFVGVDALDTAYAPASVGIAYRPYALGAAVTGTTTSGSPSLTNVASASSYFRVGDFIGGRGIPSKTRVTAVSGTTVTLSKNATVTANNVALYMDRAWRDDVPNDSAEAFFAARDTTTDDSKPIMACLNYWGRCRLLSGSNYAISAKIVMPDGSELVGDNHQLAILKPTAGFLGPVVEPNLRCTVRDVAVFGLDEASSIGIQPGTTGSGVLLDRVSIADFAEGLVVDGSGTGQFTFRNGRLTSCTSHGARIGTTGMSKVVIADSVIQSNTTTGCLVSGAVNGLTFQGNDCTSNGTGLSFTASSLAPLVLNNHFQGNTTADCAVSANVRSLTFMGNNCVTTPTCFTTSSGVGGTIQGNTFNPGGGTPKSITLTNAAATRWNIGQNVYLAGAFAYTTDNSGTQTRYLGSIYSAGAPSSGVWEKGEVVLAETPSATPSGSNGWIVTTAGTAGVDAVFTPCYGGIAIKEGSLTHDFGSLANGDKESVNVTITGGGASLSSTAIAELADTVPDGMFLTAQVTATGTVRVTLFNVSAGTQDLASQTLTVRVFQ